MGFVLATFFYFAESDGEEGHNIFINQSAMIGEKQWLGRDW